MHRFELQIQRGMEIDVPVVRVRIDGTDLVDLAASAEQPFAEAEGHPDMAGGYDGLMPRDWLELPEQYDADGRAAVLACACGEVGCWPLRVRIEVAGDRVVWSDFQQPHRPGWDLAALGPFEFERHQYEAEVLRIQAIGRQADA